MEEGRETEKGSRRSGEGEGRRSTIEKALGEDRLNRLQELDKSKSYTPFRCAPSCFRNVFDENAA